MKLHCVFELDEDNNKWRFVKAYSKRELVEQFLDDNIEYGIYTVVETSVKRPPPPDIEEFEQEELYADISNN